MGTVRESRGISSLRRRRRRLKGPLRRLFWFLIVSLILTLCSRLGLLAPGGGLGVDVNKTLYRDLLN
jgi:cell division septal protein FtsQ